MIVFVTALVVEARPIIEKYNLKKSDIKTPFLCYASEDNQFFLAVSGVGKIRVASCISNIITLLGSNNVDYIINIGVAGSGFCDSSELGKLFLINSIEDIVTKRTYYPDILLDFEIDEVSLITSEVVVDSFENESLYDMEGSSFFETASLFLSPNRIVLLKVVSDTKDSRNVSKDDVHKYVFNNLSLVDSLIKVLLNELNERQSIVNRSYKINEVCKYYKEQLHLSEYLYSELHQLIVFCEASGFDYTGFINSYLPVNSKSDGKLVVEALKNEFI